MDSVRKRAVAIVTGCNGFMGKYLISFLRGKKKSFKIFGVDIHAAPANGVDVYIRNTSKKDLLYLIRRELGKTKKIYCFHLAGLIFEKDITKLFDNNLGITHKIFSALLPYKQKTTILNIGSSAEYGYQGKRKILEKYEANPISSYGYCKLLQTQLAEHYYQTCKLPVVMTRTFNIIGPGQTDKLVCGSLVKQVVRCKKGLADKISVEGLNAYRDFLDIRDAVRAYVMLAEKGIPGELYNVASGQAIQMKDVLNSILTIVGVSPQIVKKPIYISKESVPYQKASIGKIRKEIGWAPLHAFKKSIKNMVSFEMDNQE